MDSYRIPSKIDLTPRRYHGYAFFLFVLGTLFPPLAVAARFGFNGDFWLNVLLTICGYIPGHVHNFYIQNIRNNKNHARTPKWAQRYGLVDTSEIKRKERKSRWAHRYNDRLPNSTLESQPLEDGQLPIASPDNSPESAQANGELWRPEDETYYSKANADTSSVRTGASSSGRWHYPANFDDAVTEGRSSKKSGKKKEKKDRWARIEDAYSLSEEVASRKTKKKKKKSKSQSADLDVNSRDGSMDGFPEDAEGGMYRDRNVPPTQTPVNGGTTKDTDVFNHEL